MLIVHIWIVLGLAANANSTVYIFTVTHKNDPFPFEHNFG